MSESMVSINRILANRASPLKSANAAHMNLIAALSIRDKWTNKSNNPMLLELHRVVSTFITEAKNGMLGHFDEFELRAMHRKHYYQTSDGQEKESSFTEFEWFSNYYNALENKVEYWAQQLTAILDNPDFLHDFNDDAYIPPETRLNYCADLLYGLDQSNAGRKYLENYVASDEPETSPYLPVCAYTRIPDVGNLDTDRWLEAFEQSGQVIGRIASDLIPFLAKVDPLKVKNCEIRILSWARGRDTGLTAVDAHQAAEYLNSWLTPGRKAAVVLGSHFLLLGVLTAQVANTYEKIVSDPNWRNKAKLGEDFGDICDALATSYKNLPVRYQQKLGPFSPRWLTVSLVQRFSAGFSLVNGAWSAAEGIEDKEYAKTAFAAAKVAGSLVLLISPAGPFWLITLGTALLVTGELGIATSEKSKFQKWLELNYFGKDWKNVALEEPWDRISYKWRRHSGEGQATAHFQRQISELLSLSEDRQMEITFAEGVWIDNRFKLKIAVQTQLAYKHNSLFCVWVNFEDNSRRSYMFTIPPSLEEEQAQQISVTCTTWPSENKISYFGVFIHEVWSENPAFVEIEILLQGSPEEINAEDLEKLPNVLRARSEVHWTPFE